MLQARSDTSLGLPDRIAAYGSAPDDDLARVAGADPEAFGALYDRYADRIHGYCYVRLRTREAAEDATSQVFLKALAGLGGYRGGHFAGWLFRIARNVVVTAYQQQRPHTSLDAGDDTADSDPGPESWALRHAEHDALYDAIAHLPSDQRTVLELQLAGWTGLQIADVLGRSVPAVKMLRYRAVEQLRSTLDQTAASRQE